MMKMGEVFYTYNTVDSSGRNQMHKQSVIID